MRQEFEKNRHASKLSVVDVLLFKSHAEYQVYTIPFWVLSLQTLGTGLTPTMTGDDELLEADHPHHVLFQGGELQGRQAIAIELHDWFLGGKDERNGSPARHY